MSAIWRKIGGEKIIAEKNRKNTGFSLKTCYNKGSVERRCNRGSVGRRCNRGSVGRRCNRGSVGRRCNIEAAYKVGRSCRQYRKGGACRWAALAASRCILSVTAPSCPRGRCRPCCSPRFDAPVQRGGFFVFFLTSPYRPRETVTCFHIYIHTKQNG